MLLDIYEVDGEQAETLLTLARQAKERGWWQPFTSAIPDWFQVYVGLETEASVIREYGSELVPGQLQTADYYRAFLHTVARPDEEIEREVELRLTRQEWLASGDPSRYWAVLNEAVIRRLVGGPEVMRAQLVRILEVGRMPNATIQVLPFSAGAHAAMEGPFSILSFPGLSDPDVVYLENQAGSVYVEEADEIDRYDQAFAHLIEKALSAEDSARLISEIEREHL